MAEKEAEKICPPTEEFLEGSSRIIDKQEVGQSTKEDNVDTDKRREGVNITWTIVWRR